MEEKEIVYILKTNPQEGLEIVIDKFSKLVFCIISNKVASVCSKQDIEECMSDVFIDVYKKRMEIDLKKGKLQSYICVIAKRKAITLYNMTLKRNNTINLDEKTINTYSKSELNLDDIYIYKENRNTLIEAIKNLGKIDREIVVRKYFFLESSKEIARMLNMTVNAVDLRVHRALKKLEVEITRKNKEL